MVRLGARLAAPSAERQRRGGHDARPGGRDGRARRRARGRDDRDRPLDGAGDRAHPTLGAIGSGRVVRDPRGPERAARRSRPGRRGRLRGTRPRRPHAAHPLPREHRGGQVRRDHGDRRRRPAGRPALGSAPAHVHGCALRGAAAPWSRTASECAGPAPRGGRDSHASLDTAVRGLLAVGGRGERGRQPRARTRPLRALSPAHPGATRRRRGTCRARGSGAARTHLSDLLLGGRSIPAGRGCGTSTRSFATRNARAPS